MLRTSLWLAVVAASGCALVPGAGVDGKPRDVPPARILSDQWLQPRANTTPLTVRREGSGGGHRSCGDELSVDGAEVAVLEPGDRIVLYLPFGDHLLSTRAAMNPSVRNLTALCMGNTTEAVVRTEPGTPQLYRLLQDPSGEMQLRRQWQLAPGQRG
jgi:hypothetical protein